MIKKKLLPFILALVLAIFAAGCRSKPVQGAAPAISKEGKTIFLHTNDTHGRMLTTETSVGISAVSALKARYEAQGYNVVLLDTGDTFHGTALATLDQGESIVELMKLAGYDAMVPGNHDFNYGSERLVQLSHRAPFPVLSSNLVERGSDKKLLDGYAVVQRDNIKIGIFGLCTPETASKTNPANVQDLTFYDPYEAAAEAVSVLKSAEVDYIVALCHLGLNQTSHFTSEGVARAVAGIDLIIDGHSHTELEQGKKVGHTLIVSTGEYMKAVGVVTLEHATRNATAELIRAGDERLNGLTDSAVDARLYEVDVKQKAVLAQVLGNTPVMLNGARSDVRTKETNLGNTLADAMRTETGAPIALINAGTIRDSIAEGDITKGDVINTLPFGNYIVTKKLNGATLRALLEGSVKAYPEENSGFLQVSGIAFSFDPESSPGKRVKNVWVAGQPLDASAEYLVAINDFMAAGGDNLAILAKAKQIHEFTTLDEALIDHIQRVTLQGQSFPETGERILLLSESSAGSGVTVSATPEEPAVTVSTLFASPVEDVQPDEDGWVYYVVDYDDNIWNIAKEQLHDVNMWDELLEANRDIIKHPDEIYVGQRLRLPKVS